LIDCQPKDALQERVKLHKIWKDNEVTLAKKRETKVKMELAHKVMEKVMEAEKEVKEVGHACLMCRIDTCG